ncbi:MAG: hypothetical protein O3A00_16625 [Planctomycetota bacterium]|nr:hypothetical protein [Planctomycetota bacterium]
MKQLLGFTIVLGLLIGCGDTKTMSNADNKSVSNTPAKTQGVVDPNPAKSVSPGVSPEKKTETVAGPGVHPGANQPGNPGSKTTTSQPKGNAANNPFVKFFSGAHNKVKGQ